MGNEFKKQIDPESSSGSPDDQKVDSIHAVTGGLSRRSFVYGAVGIAGLVCVGGAAKFLPSNPDLVRPPGGTREDVFLAKCTRCDRCRSVCPTSAIAPARLEDGLLVVRTPKMNFHLGECNYCAKCTEVCPTGALAPHEVTAFDYTPSIKNKQVEDVFDSTSKTYYQPNLPIVETMGLAEVDKIRCIAWDSVSGGCIKCFTECPYDAITLDEWDRPIIDDGKCIGCGVCEFVCPSNELRSFKGGDSRGINVKRRKDKQGQ